MAGDIISLEGDPQNGEQIIQGTSNNSVAD